MAVGGLLATLPDRVNVLMVERCAQFEVRAMRPAVVVLESHDQ